MNREEFLEHLQEISDKKQFEVVGAHTDELIRKYGKGIINSLEEFEVPEEEKGTPIMVLTIAPKVREIFMKVSNAIVNGYEIYCIDYDFIGSDNTTLVIKGAKPIKWVGDCDD